MTGLRATAGQVSEKAPEPPSQISKYAGRLVRGAAVEVVGFGAAQLIRLGSNLVLTRLLFPEAFGLMAMLSVLTYGLVMLSDVGLAQAVIRSERGDDPAFLDTAWSIQAVRGFVLWMVACVLAWPMSLLFREPILLVVIPVGSASAFINGLHSTRTLSLRRRLLPLPIILLETGTQVLGVVLMIALALRGYGVWSLVAGNLLTAAALTGGSYLLPGSHRPRLRSDPSARTEIIHFGRWIYASSAVTFAAQRGDQLVLGRLLGAGSLGLYNIGLALAEAPEALANRVLSGIFFPLYSKLRVENPEQLREAYYRSRFAFDAVVHTSLGGLVALAPWLIDLLYDERYRGSTPMLQILALRTALALLAAPCENVLFSLGHSQYAFRRNVSVAVATIIAMPIGNALAGPMGLLWGTTIARLPALAILWPAVSRHGLFDARRESLPVLFLAAGFGIGTVLRYILPAF